MFCVAAAHIYGVTVCFCLYFVHTHTFMHTRKYMQHFFALPRQCAMNIYKCKIQIYTWRRNVIYQRMAPDSIFGFYVCVIIYFFFQ